MPRHNKLFIPPVIAGGWAFGMLLTLLENFGVATLWMHIRLNNANVIFMGSGWVGGFVVLIVLSLVGACSVALWAWINRTLLWHSQQPQLTGNTCTARGS